MRIAKLIPAALFVMLAVPALAATAWTEYTNREEKFRINFPGEPTVESFTYRSEYDLDLPAKRFTVVQGPSRYSLTVINYDGTQVTDARGAVAYAALAMRKKGGEVTFDAYAQIDRIEGHQLQITNPDRSRTFWAAHLHAKRLYVLEATVPPGAPPPALFQVSLSILDDQGNSVRYNIDHDGQRTPARGGGRGGAQGGGAAGGGDGG
jgi:hypothetical protein